MAAAGRSIGRRAAGDHRPVVVEGPAERVDDASEQAVAHGHVHDPARALDFVARVQMPVVAEQHDADFVLVDVERDAEHVAGKSHQFVGADAGKTGNHRDARGDVGDRPDLARRQPRREGLAPAAETGERAVEGASQRTGRRAQGVSTAAAGSIPGRPDRRRPPGLGVASLGAAPRAIRRRAPAARRGNPRWSRRLAARCAVSSMPLITSGAVSKRNRDFRREGFVERILQRRRVAAPAARRRCARERDPAPSRVPRQGPLCSLPSSSCKRRVNTSTRRSSRLVAARSVNALRAMANTSSRLDG